jgi:hypothetical protein
MCCNLGLISNLMYKIFVYLHIKHLLKSSTCFEHYPAHHQEVYVVIVYMQSLVLSLSAGDCLVHQLRKNSSWRSNQGYTMMLGQPIIKIYVLCLLVLHLLCSSFH